jgi:hypothetical protein
MKKIAMLALWTALASSLFAAEGPVPKDVSHLDHVFLIMMENHAYGQIVGNPNAPFAKPTQQVREFRDQLLCHRPPQLDQLPGSGGRIELRGAQRQ